MELNCVRIDSPSIEKIKDALFTQETVKFTLQYKNFKVGI